jgi:hypothetical protein
MPEVEPQDLLVDGPGVIQVRLAPQLALELAAYPLLVALPQELETFLEATDPSPSGKAHANTPGDDS